MFVWALTLCQANGWYDEEAYARIQIAHEEFASEDITDLVKGANFAIKDVEDSDDSEDDEICVVNEEEQHDGDIDLPEVSLTTRVLN